MFIKFSGLSASNTNLFKSQRTNSYPVQNSIAKDMVQFSGEGAVEINLLGALKELGMQPTEAEANRIYSFASHKADVLEKELTSVAKDINPLYDHWVEAKRDQPLILEGSEPVIFVEDDWLKNPGSVLNLEKPEENLQWLNNLDAVARLTKEELQEFDGYLEKGLLTKSESLPDVAKILDPKNEIDFGEVAIKLDKIKPRLEALDWLEKLSQFSDFNDIPENPFLIKRPNFSSLSYKERTQLLEKTIRRVKARLDQTKEVAKKVREVYEKTIKDYLMH